MRRRTVLSMEQATALPHATQRFAQLGWRVIRIEATGEPGAAQPGDPNRYVGKKVADDDRHALFIPPNTGKEAIALNLKSAEGRAVLHRLVTALDADVFTCNTLPSRYKQLGIDYETLSAIKPDIIWASISALGHGVPTFAGYDPVVQAMSGLMDINGFKDGPPTLMGLPISDLKAGDEVYANVLLALLEKAESGRVHAAGCDVVAGADPAAGGHGRRPVGIEPHRQCPSPLRAHQRLSDARKLRLHGVGQQCAVAEAGGRAAIHRACR